MMQWFCQWYNDKFMKKLMENSRVDGDSQIWCGQMVVSAMLVHVSEGHTIPWSQ